MTEDYVKVTHTDQVSVGDIVRATVEGRVLATYENPGTDPSAAPTRGGIVIRDSAGSRHEVFPDSINNNVNVIRFIEDPRLAPGQMWRGGDARFVAIGNDIEGYVLHHTSTGIGYRPNEFFTRYRDNNELIQEPV